MFEIYKCVLSYLRTPRINNCTQPYHMHNDIYSAFINLCFHNSSQNVSHNIRPSLWVSLLTLIRNCWHNPSLNTSDWCSHEESKLVSHNINRLTTVDITFLSIPCTSLNTERGIQGLQYKMGRLGLSSLCNKAILVSFNQHELLEGRLPTYVFSNILIKWFSLVFLKHLD